jgi:hypothetical protein
VATDRYFRINKWSYEEFVAGYDPQDAVGWRSSSGETLLHRALHNSTPAARVAIADRLLDDGADAAALTADQVGVLHVLFAENRHDFGLEAPLLGRLLDAGADLNAVSPVWGTPLQVLARKLKFSDDDLAPFYDVVFARPGIDLEKEGSDGWSSLETARRLGEGRPQLVARMEAYLEQHGQPTPTS